MDFLRYSLIVINSEKFEFWVPFYVKKVPFWSPFCSKLGPLWVPFLQFLGPLEIALFPNGSPLGDPGPLGDLFGDLGPLWVPILCFGSPFSPILG